MRCVLKIEGKKTDFEVFLSHCHHQFVEYSTSLLFECWDLFLCEVFPSELIYRNLIIYTYVRMFIFNYSSVAGRNMNRTFSIHVFDFLINLGVSSYFSFRSCEIDIIFLFHIYLSIFLTSKNVFNLRFFFSFV